MEKVKIIIELKGGLVNAVYANTEISYILVEEDNLLVGSKPVSGPYAADEIFPDPRFLYRDSDLWDKIKHIDF